MKDTRAVLDAVRMRIPGDAKLLVIYQDRNGVLRLSQANMTQHDISVFASSIQLQALKA